MLGCASSHSPTGGRHVEAEADKADEAKAEVDGAEGPIVEGVVVDAVTPNEGAADQR